MPFAQSQKTKSQEPLQRICSSPVGASAGIKTKSANAPMIAQIVVIIFDFIIWKFMVWKFIVKFDENSPIVPRLHPCREILFLLLLSLFRNRWKFGILICHWKIHPLHPKIHLACNCFDTDVSWCCLILITAAKLSIKIEYPNKILLFIKNLCFCSLKIAVCVPKLRRSLKIAV